MGEDTAVSAFGIKAQSFESTFPFLWKLKWLKTLLILQKSSIFTKISRIRWQVSPSLTKSSCLLKFVGICLLSWRKRMSDKNLALEEISAFGIKAQSFESTFPFLWKLKWLKWLKTLITLQTSSILQK